MKRLFNPKECEQCGVIFAPCSGTQKYCSPMCAREQKRERKRRYRAEHREHRREYDHRYYVDHREQKRDRNRRYYAEHIEQQRERKRRYRDKAKAADGYFQTLAMGEAIAKTQTRKEKG
jgi:hypothetical protein